MEMTIEMAFEELLEAPLFTEDETAKLRFLLTHSPKALLSEYNLGAEDLAALRTRVLRFKARLRDLNQLTDTFDQLPMAAAGGTNFL